MALAPHVKITARSFPVAYTVGSTADDTFDFSGPFWVTADILVYQDGELVDSSLYTITGLYEQDGLTISGAYGGGTVTFLDPVSNCEITIDRKVVVQRDTDFSSSAPLSISNLNSDLDKAVARDQDLEARITDLEAAEGAAVTPGAWANITGRPSNLLAFASLNGAANKVPYFTSAGAMALADFADGDLTGKANTDLSNVSDATMKARTLAVGGVVSASGEAGFEMPPRAANLGLTLRMNAITGNIEGYTPSSGSGATDWSSLTGKPTTFEPITESVQDIVASLVAAGSGIGISYNDAAASLTISYTGTTAAWADITGKPSTFEPTTESVQDIVGAFVIAGTGITATYSDAGNTLTIANSGALADLSNTQVQVAATGEALTAPAIMNRQLSLLKFIPTALWAAILDGTSTTSVSTYIQEALDEAVARGGAEILVDEGVYRTDRHLYIGSKTKLKGKGARSIIKTITGSWTPTGALSTGLFTNVMFANKNFLASALTDEDIILEDMTLDHNGLSYGDGHIWAMRYVDKPQRRFARFLNGGSATPALACRDSLVIGCHAYNMGASYYDHWDGVGYSKVIGSTGRNPSGRGIQQGIQFTGTATDYADRTSSVSLSMGNQIYGCRGTGYGSGDTAAAIIANCADPGSYNRNFKSVGDFVEDADIGLVFGGKGGEHECVGLTLKNVTTVPVLIQDEGSSEVPSNCFIDGVHMIDCAHSVANPAMVSVGGGSRHTIRGLKFTNGSGSSHVWLASATSNCTVDPIDGAAPSGTAVINSGTSNTVNAWNTHPHVIAGSDGSGAYTDFFAPAHSYRARVRDAGSLSFNGSIQASTTLNATTDISLGSSGLIVFGAGSGYWIQKLGADCYWREPSGPSITKMN